MTIAKDWDRAFLADSKGSAATRDRAWRTWNAVKEFSKEKKWDLAPATITPKQMRLYLADRAAVISPRCVQLEASHLRRAIAGAGRDIGNVRDKQNTWSSARMGVPEGSRLGMKAAADPAKYEAAKEKMLPDVRACIGVIDSIGLRLKEGVMAGSSLKEWSRELAKSESRVRGVHLHVVHGTKTGRPRWTLVPPEKVEAVSKAVAVALQSCAGNKSGSVIEADDLKKALKRVSSCLYRQGLVGDNSVHGLRRGFAHEQYKYYRDSGLSEKEALIRLSQDLGHGDGRGRWVWNNYLRGGEGGGE